MEEFIPGQRWISNAELQLGLGTIISTDFRTVTISFAASDETRIYAQQDSPLTRVIYDAGEEIKTITGDSLIISNITDLNGLISYTGINSQGESTTIEEKQLDHFIQLNRPAERLFSGQIDKNRWFELRYQTLKELNHLSHSRLSGLTGCRTSLIAHQLYIAHEVANRYAPRVLLADEVGLGKTIEAGLILHHQLLNERAQRVLIVVPESLLHQWLVEMLRRFNLMFSIFDEQRCQALLEQNDDQQELADKPPDNPFLSEQLVLCSLEFLSNNESYFQQSLQGEWDLLVVDEAHHLQWAPEVSSHEYQLIEQLAKHIRGLLLLTATPEQLGIESHFARLRLLDPDRFPDLESFKKEESGYQPIAHAMDTLLSDKPFDAIAQKTLKRALLEENFGQDEAKSTQQIDASLERLLKQNNAASELDSQTFAQQLKDKQILIEHMLDRHGTGRVLFRNTRSAIKGFPGRQLFAHAQPLPEEYQLGLEQYISLFKQQALEHNNNISQPPIAGDFSNLVLFPELLYQILADASAQMQSWLQFDPRVKWLGDWLFEQKQSQNENGKTLVITANLQTAKDLAHALKSQFGVYAAVFHEELSLIERDRAAAFFAEPENGAPVLICSEIGSEGRNFQFAHQMVLFDLPLNPDLLEQRIGRLDRIGQSQTIAIHIPYLKNTAQEVLFHWYHQGLNAFEQTCPSGHTIFTQVQQQLQSLLMTAYSPASNSNTALLMADLLTQTQSLHQQLDHTLHEGRDKLLEYNSCRQPEANQLKALAEEIDQQSTLFQYINHLFDALGIEHSEHSKDCYIVSPGEHMLNQFPGLPEDGMTITYDRDIALANEDMHFFSWEHPMVRNGMEMISSSEMGNTGMSTLDSSKSPIALKPGSILLECLFVIEATTHKTLQANRYLPTSSIRILLDERGQELTQKISHGDIQATEKIKRRIAQQIIKVKEELLQQLISKAEQLCQKQIPALIESAKEASQQTLVNEISRLKTLAQVNPNIRQEEIDFYIEQLDSLESIFSSINPRLDALRVIVVT